jgi:hypothetical protein
MVPGAGEPDLVSIGGRRALAQQLLSCVRAGDRGVAGDQQGSETHSYDTYAFHTLASGGCVILRPDIDQPIAPVGDCAVMLAGDQSANPRFAMNADEAATKCPRHAFNAKFRLFVASEGAHVT